MQQKNDFAGREVRFQELGRRVKKLSLAEEELDEEIRFCKQEKTGEAAVHLNPTDAASIRPWWSSSSRWERHTEGSRSKLCTKSSVKGLRCCMKLQSRLCTLGEEKKEETNMRRSKSKGQPSAIWVNQRQEAAIKGFRLVLFLILIGVRTQMVKAAEAISIHREANHTTEIGLVPQLIRLADNSNRFMMMEAFEGKMGKKEGNQKLKRRNSQEKETRTFEENCQGRNPRTLGKSSQEGYMSASYLESQSGEKVEIS